MKKIKIYLFIVLILVFKSGIGQEKEYLSLDNYLEIAANNSPELKAAYNLYLASLEKVPQLGTLPDPQSTFGFFTKPMAILGGNQVGNLQIMQMFPWFGTLKIAKDEATEMAKAKFEIFNETKADLIFQLKSNWFQLVKLDHEISLVEENLELLKSLDRLVTVKFQSPVSDGASTGSNGDRMLSSTSTGTMNTAAGGMGGMNNSSTTSTQKPVNMQSGEMSSGMGSKTTGLQDILRVKMEILEQQNKLAQLIDQRKTTEANFNALLNRDQNIRVVIKESLELLPLSVEKQAIADSILKNNPMLAMLANEVTSYEIMGQKAKKMGLPMLGVGLNYMLIQEREDNTFMMNGEDMLMPMFSVSIPVYRKKYDAMEKEAQLMQEAAKQETISLQNKLKVQYRSFIQNLEDAERRVSLYRVQQELARKTMDLILANFASTGADYEEVLRMQFKVLDYGFKHIEAITDYNISVAMAEKLMGRLIW